MPPSAVAGCAVSASRCVCKSVYIVSCFPACNVLYIGHGVFMTCIEVTITSSTNIPILCSCYSKTTPVVCVTQPHIGSSISARVCILQKSGVSHQGGLSITQAKLPAYKPGVQPSTSCAMVSDPTIDVIHRRAAAAAGRGTTRPAWSRWVIEATGARAGARQTSSLRYKRLRMWYEGCALQRAPSIRPHGANPT